MPGGYAVRDVSGRIVAHIYGREEAGEGLTCYPTMDEAKEMALNLAKAGGAGLIGFKSKLELARLDKQADQKRLARNAMTQTTIATAS